MPFDEYQTTRAISRSDRCYPRRLLDLPRPPPIFLSGSVDWTAQTVAIVGSRAAWQRDLKRARKIAASAVKAGAVVVSGGALGIDAAAHESALEHGGQTVAVLGTGLDIAYPPRHEALFRQIAKRGQLLTSFERGTPPRAGNFPRRNRLIAALADRVIIVASQARSGSLHTARVARKLGRLVLAVDGTPGCDALIACGHAQCYGEDTAPDRHAVLAPEDAEVIAQLTACGCSDAHELASLLGRTVQETALALARLSKCGAVTSRNGLYRRV